MLYAFEKRFADSYQIFREMDRYAKEDQDEYLMFLCKKAWVYYLDNQPKKAKKTVSAVMKKAGDINQPRCWQVKGILQKFWNV